MANANVLVALECVGAAMKVVPLNRGIQCPIPEEAGILHGDRVQLAPIAGVDKLV
jgi:hypothetical protein